VACADELDGLLRQRIATEGPLSFAEVMRLALYHPACGYYTRLRGFGASGDFVTSPELHPLFGLLLARQVDDLWAELGRPARLRVLEIGGGTGALARSLLDGLTCRVEYVIDEPSPSLRARQADPRLSSDAAGVFDLVLANEVLDAQPVHRLVMRDRRLREMRVDRDLRWVETAAPPEAEAYFQRLGMWPPEGGVAEINLQLDGWTRAAAGRLASRGMLLVLDYGYPAEQLFGRGQGTLLTYYRHTLGSDPLVRLGEQDISAHVDFTTLATAAHAAGLDVLGVTSQRSLLHNLGYAAAARQLRAPADRQAAAPLVDPEGLGRIGALFLARGLPGYHPVGLVGRNWPAEERVPTLDPRLSTVDDFLDQWREAFALES